MIYLPTNALAIVEFSATYYYTKQSFPNSNTTVEEDVSATRTYSGTLAWYVFNNTAIELFYSSNEDINIDNGVNLTDTSTGKTINTLRSVLVTDSLGIGIRQALASRKSRLIPTISIGHSSQTQMTKYRYFYTDGTSGSIESGKIESDVSYLTISLRLRITELLGLTGSITGTYSDFDFSEDPDQLRYSAGLSWIF